jgi:hypothetical protein
MMGVVRVYRLKATLQSDDGKTWVVRQVDYLMEKKAEWESSKFVSHDHYTEWIFVLKE